MYLFKDIKRFVAIFCKLAAIDYESLAAKYDIDIEEVKRIQNLSPLPDGNINWVIQQVTSNFDESDIWPTLNLFIQKRDKLAEKNIESYKDIKEMENELKTLPTSNSERKNALKHQKSKSEELYSDDEWLLIRADNKKACVEIGEGTQWCITMTNAMHYEDYTSKNTLFYMLISKQQNKGIFNKIAFSVERNLENEVITTSVFDSQDARYSMGEIKKQLGPIIDKVSAILETNAPIIEEGLFVKFVRGSLSTHEALKLFEEYDFNPYSQGDIKHIFSLCKDPKYLQAFKGFNHPTAIYLTLDYRWGINLLSYTDSPSTGMRTEAAEIIPAQYEHVMINGLTNYNGSSIEELKEKMIRLSKDKSLAVQKELIYSGSNIQLPIEVILNFAKSDNEEIRLDLLRKKAVPNEVAIEMGKNDPSINVRDSAAFIVPTEPDVVFPFLRRCFEHIESKPGSERESKTVSFSMRSFFDQKEDDFVIAMSNLKDDNLRTEALKYLLIYYYSDNYQEPPQWMFENTPKDFSIAFLKSIEPITFVYMISSLAKVQREFIDVDVVYNAVDSVLDLYVNSHNVKYYGHISREDVKMALILLPENLRKELISKYQIKVSEL